MASSSLAFRAALSLALFAGFYLLGIGVAVTLLVVAWSITSLHNVGLIKISWACVAGAGVVLWSLRPRRDQFTPPGPRVTETDQPALFAVIGDVSRAAAQPVPHDVFIVSDLTAWVANRGGTMGLGGERVMTLGLALLQVLTVGELKAVIAHELGHFSGGDTRLGHIVYRTRAAIVRTLQDTQGRLVEILFRGYAVLFMRTSMAVSRNQEFAADAFAARLTDPGALASSLSKVQRTAPAFSFYRHMALGNVLAAGFRPPLAAGFLRFLEHPVAQQIAEQAAAAPAVPNPYDSHPPTQERVSALVSMPAGVRGAAVSAERDRQPAISLLRNLPLLEAVVLSHEGVESGKLTAIDWPDVPSRVYVPMWRTVVERHMAALGQVTIAELPASQTEVVTLGRKVGTPQIKLMDAEHVMSLMGAAIAAAVALRLFDEGWSVSDAAGLHLTRGALVVEPFVEIPAIINGDAVAGAKWKEICRAADLTGPLVRPAGAVALGP